MDGNLANLKFTVVNLGCKVNRVEADAVAAALAVRGGAAVALEDAELVVVNTCTVTGEADRKARKAVRHALSAAPAARVIVTGCAVAIDADEFATLDPRVEVVQRADLLAEAGAGAGAGALRVGEGFRTRVGVKVQDGCDRACSYCIVHVARGRATSVPLEDALAECSRYLERGVKEIVLTGIDLGSWRDGARRLEDLVEGVLELADRSARGGERPARVRASSLEPDSLSGRFVELLATSDGRLCRHLHLPLQSGSSKVLREMGRSYSAGRFAEIAAGLYDAVPQLSLTTDVICGFPGETAGDFAETLALVRECRFSKVHVFPYSRRAGTPAAGRADQVDPQVKAARAAELRALADDLRAADLARRAGTRELVLVEGATALAESYHEVPAPEGARPGELVSAQLG